jgi:hypothetical protein
MIDLIARVLSSADERAQMMRVGIERASPDERIVLQLALDISDSTGPIGADISDTLAVEENYHRASNVGQLVDDVRNQEDMDVDGEPDDQANDEPVEKAWRALQKISDVEIRDFNLANEILDKYRSGGTSLEEACRELNLGDWRKPYMPLTAVGITLYSWQVIGVEWIIRRLKGPLRAALLADAMGLGKTIQCLCVLAHIRREINEGDQNWERKPSIILAPKAALTQLDEETQRVLDSAMGWQVKVYGAGLPTLTRANILAMSERHVIITTCQLLNQRHGQSKKAKWMDMEGRRLEGSRVVADERDWPDDLSNCFSVGVIDEAHALKDPYTKTWLAVKSLNLTYRVLASGTPTINRDEDLEGLMGLMEHDSIWQDLGENPRSCNPYKFSKDDPRAVLQCSQSAIRDILRKLPATAYIERSELMAQSYTQAMLKRGYNTKINNIAIGAAIPPMKRSIVSITADASTQRKMDGVAEKNFEKLMALGPSKSKVIMNATKARQLAHAATWAVFDGFEMDSRRCAEFRRPGRDLYDFVEAVGREVGPQSLGFDITNIPDFWKTGAAEHKQRLLMAVAAYSPKLRYLCFALSVFTIIQ